MIAFVLLLNAQSAIDLPWGEGGLPAWHLNKLVGGGNGLDWVEEGLGKRVRLVSRDVEGFEVVAGNVGEESRLLAGRFKSSFLKVKDTMADVNVNVPAEQAPAMAPPTRTDEQILPSIRWVPIGKSNCYLDTERSESNLIYKIAVDILKQTNFFRAFTASSTIPAIYIQQFWDTICYDRIVGGYKCQLDEQWFDLTKDTLRDALQITPVNNNKTFASPPTPDALIQFVNDLGYPKEVRHLSNVVTNDMFQPWRALTTIINLCLTGKTSGFKRPRAPVLQILWGVINRAHIDYAERMWEEFTQSIHTFTEDKKNLTQRTLGKKKATLIVIPSVSAKGTKREVFGLPIPNELITDDIRGAQYYNAYQEKVAKNQRYLVGEEESSEAPSPAKRSKAGKVTKKQKPKSSLQLVDETVKEGVPDKEPVYGDEEADLQRALELSMKDHTERSQGPLPPMAIREPESGKFQPLLDVQLKGKEKVSEVQVALDLLTLQTPKKTSPADQYIFQRRTFTPTEPSGHEDSSSMYVELGLSDSDTESDEEVPPVVKSGVQDEGQARPNPGIQDEGQARPNPGIQDEGRAGPNPDDETEPQPLSTPIVHAGPNLEHTDVEATDDSNQPHPKQMDEGFTATAYPKVQENLKLKVEEQVIPEEPASSTGTLSSLQHIAKDFSFGDQFLNDKPSEADNEKITADTEAESMVTVTVHQDTSAIPPVTSPVIDLVSRPDSPNEHRPPPTTATTTTTTIMTTLPLPPQPQQGSSDSTLI
ncbi:retrovirus-related pol polyprotein from transposon TNT 1-94 [Tanacetum coccineum]